MITDHSFYSKEMLRQYSTYMYIIPLPRNSQGWDFVHQFSERIARFLPKNERFAHDRSFPLSDLSESLMVAHFW